MIPTAIRRVSLPLICAGVITALSWCETSLAQTAPITMSGMGFISEPNPPPSGATSGDTWYSTWRQDGSVILQWNDGLGFNGPLSSWPGTPHDGLANLQGTPANLGSLSGTNLSGTFLGQTYSSDTYDVAGVLYHILVYQHPSASSFSSPNIYESTNGGVDWINSSGQTDTLLPDDTPNSMFPDTAGNNGSGVTRFSYPQFVKYGQGGAAPTPAVDQADQYVYIYSPDIRTTWSNFYLARVLRTDLPSLNPAKIQYYVGCTSSDPASCADATQASSWVPWDQTASINPMLYSALAGVASTLYYNAGLGRYILTTGIANSSPTHDAIYWTYEAPHPWGPWTRITDESPSAKHNMVDGFASILQAFTSSDGSKGWITLSGDPGSGNYTLHFAPVYYTTNQTARLEAEQATLNGGDLSVGSDSGASNGEYLSGFNTVGDSATLNANVTTAGAYLLSVRFRTNTTVSTRTLTLFTNGNAQKLRFGQTDQYATYYGETFTSEVYFVWLNAGANTLTFQYFSDDQNTADIKLDCVTYALYSTVPGSLPGAYPTPPITTDKSSYASGEPIGVTFAGGAGNREDWIGIVPVNTNAYVDWLWVNGTQTLGGNYSSGVVNFTNAIPAGTYQAVLFNDNLDTQIARSVPFTVGAQGGPIANPGFETGSLSPWVDGGDGGTLAVVTGHARTDAYALSMAGTAMPFVEQTISGLTPGQTYTVHGYGMVSGGATVRIGVWHYDGSTDLNSAQITSTGYTEGTVSFIPTGTTATIYCWMDTSSAGTAYCDDFTLSSP